MPKNPVNPKLKKLVLDALKHHAWNLGVSEYQGNIFYMEEDEKREDGCLLHANITVDTRYLKATIRIFPCAIKEWETREKESKGEGDKFINGIIAHEVSHIITQPMFDLAVATYKNEGELKDAWESLTERISRLTIALDKLKK
jgi:hypothetical protein